MVLSYVWKIERIRTKIIFQINFYFFFFLKEKKNNLTFLQNNIVIIIKERIESLFNFHTFNNKFT